MKEAIAKCLSAALLCLLLTACADKTELNERAFVNSLALDWQEGGFHAEAAVYDLTSLDGKSAGGENGAEKSIRQGDGGTVSEAVKKADEGSAQILFFGHSKAAVIGERLAKNKKPLMEALDALERDWELSRKSYVFISEGEAYKALGAKTGGEGSAGEFIDKYFSKSREETFSMNLEELFISLRNSENALVPRITVENDGLKIGGSAIVKDFELCGFLDEASTRGLMWQKGKTKGAVVAAEYSGIQTPVTVLSCSAKTVFYDNGEGLAMRITAKVSGNLGEHVFGYDYDDASIAEIEELTECVIEKEITGAFDELKALDADAADIKSMLKKKNYALWQKYAGDWAETFRTISVEAQANVKIKGAGRIK